MTALVSQGELFSSMAFSLTHPSFFMQALGYDALLSQFTIICVLSHALHRLSLCAVFGVMIIYTTVKEFGALIFATIMTTRQLLNILLSCIIFLHPLTLMQWVGVAMVFGTMYVKSSDKKERSHGHGNGGASAGAKDDKNGARIEVKVEKVRWGWNGGTRRRELSAFFCVSSLTWSFCRGRNRQEAGSCSTGIPSSGRTVVLFG